MALKSRLLGHPLWYRILELLGDHANGLNRVEMQQALDVSEGSIFPALARGVGAGLIEVEGEAGSCQYSLTEKGRAKLRELSV